MSDMSFLPRRGAIGLVIILFLLQSVVPVEAQTATPTVTHSFGGTYASDTNSQILRIDVTNPTGSPATYDKIQFSVTATAGANDALDFATDTFDQAWPVAVTDADSDGFDEVATFTGGTLAAGATKQFAAGFKATAPSVGGTIEVTVKAFQGTTEYAGTLDPIKFAARTIVPTLVKNAAEPNTAGEVDVKLNIEPKAAVTVKVTTTATDVVLDKQTLTFTPSNFATNQRVKITPADDAIDNDARKATLTFSIDDAGSSNEWDNAPDATQDVPVTDDDTNSIIVEGGRPRATEGGAAGTFKVRLGARPSANVELSVIGKTGTAAVAGTDYTVSPARLTFTPGDWLTAQTVTITAIDDSEDELALEEAEITLSVIQSSPDAGYNNVASRGVKADIADDDGPAIIIEETDQSTEISEADGARSDTITIRLAEAPSETTTVTIKVPSQYEGDLTINPKTLVFDALNAKTPKTVLLTAIQDDRAEGLETFDLTAEVTNGGLEYLGMKQSISVLINDDDAVGVIVEQSGGTTVATECAGAISNRICDNPAGRDEITVRLERQPASNVVIDITASVDGEVVIDTPVLTFTETNWNQAKTVRISAIDDDDSTGHRDIDLVLAVDEAMSDAAWAGFDPIKLKMTVKDNEPTLTFNPYTLSTEEGDDVTYTVALTRVPTADVEVAITTPSGITSSSSSLTFTTENWETPQSVTLGNRDDSAKDGDRSFTIKHALTSDDIGFDGAKVRDLPLTVKEDDEVDVVKANRDLQRTLTVKRDGDENFLEWDADDLDTAPNGIQVWRANSPFKLIHTINADDVDFQREQYRDTDNDAERTSRYVITAFYGNTEELGFFQNGDDLEGAPGYADFTLADFEELGAAGSDDDVSGSSVAIVAVLVSLVIVAVVVFLVVYMRRRDHSEDDWEDDFAEDDDDPEADKDPLAEDWTSAGWKVQRRKEPDMGEWESLHDEPEESTWTDAPVPGREHKQRTTAREKVWTDAGWSPEEPAEEPWADGGKDAAEPWAEAEEGPAWEDESAPWEDAAAPESDAQTFHLTCPQCKTDFDATGTRPLTTTCPGCGVQGVLR